MADRYPTTRARVGVAAGSGLLIRLDEAVLFFPTGAPFATSDLSGLSIDELVAVIADAVLADPTGFPDFALVIWSDPNDLRVHLRGDTAITVEPSELTPLTARESTTWAEHHVAPSDRVTTSLHLGPAAAGATDLVAGAVPAAGFEVELDVERIGQDASMWAPGADPQTDAAVTDGAPRPGHSADRLDDERIDWMEESLHLAPRTIDAARSGRGLRTRTDAPDTTQRPHATSPTIVEVPDGTRFELDASIVLGRQPDPVAARSPDSVPVRLVAAGTVSRTHLRLHADGATTFATDCDSSSGTAYLAAGSSQPIRLDAWTSYPVGPGDRLYLGAREAVVTIHAPHEGPAR